MIMEEYTLPIGDRFLSDNHGWILSIDFGEDKELCSKFIGKKDAHRGDMDKTIILNGEKIRLTGYDKFHKMFGGWNHLDYGFRFEPIGE